MVEYPNYLEVCELRDSVQTPWSDTSVAAFLELQFRSLKYNLLTHFRSQKRTPNQMRELQFYAEFHQKLQGSLPTRAKVAADYVRDIALIRAHTYGLLALEQGFRLDFALWCDVAAGATGVVGAILLGDFQRRDPDLVNDVIMEILCDESSPPSSLSQQTDEYYRLRQDALEMAALLDRNPAGYLLTDYYIANLIRNPNRLGRTPLIGLNQSPQCMTAGAQLAQTLYLQIYPQTEGLNLPV